MSWLLFLLAQLLRVLGPAVAVAAEATVVDAAA